MNILFLDAYYEPETIAYTHLEKDLIEVLIKDGHKIKIICPTPTRGISQEVRQKYKNIKYEEKYNGSVVVNRFMAPSEGKNPIIRAIRYFWCNWCTYKMAIKYTKELDYSIIENWIDMGCVLQINRTSILGMHGKQIQSNALSLLDNGYCDVIATDTHRASGNRISKLSDVYSVVSKRIGKENASILMYENPKRILSDMDILNIEVVKKKKRFSFFRR